MTFSRQTNYLFLTILDGQGLSGGVNLRQTPLQIRHCLVFTKCLFFSSAMWIGLSDVAQESDFRWVNGDPLRYEKFSAEQRQGNTYNCVTVDPAGEWNDSLCSDNHTYLCSSLGLWIISDF